MLTTMRIRRLLLAGAVAGAVLACADDLPTSPSDLTAGIIIYEHANYLGESALILEDISDLSGVKGPCNVPAGGSEGNWNDCISSVRVAPGWNATLYRDPSYGDDRLTITADVPNLQLVDHDCRTGGLNDCVSSIRVAVP